MPPTTSPPSDLGAGGTAAVPRVRPRALKIATVAVIGSLALVALAHAGPLRPFLALLPGSKGACPVSIKGLTPEQIEAHRVRANQSLAGTTPAASRPAGPFVLALTTRADVESWARAANVSCGSEQSGTALRCVDVAPEALRGAADAPRASDAFFRFDPAGHLVGADIIRRPSDGAHAVALASALNARLEREAGAATTRSGDFDSAYFDAPGMKMSLASYRFTDYAADVSVARTLGEAGVSVREQYRLIAP